MSYTRIVGFIIAAAKADINHTAYRIGTIICEHENDKNGICTPSQDRIAKISGVHRTNVSRAIKELEEAGLVNIHAQNAPGKTTKSGMKNVYTFNFPKVERILIEELREEERRIESIHAEERGCIKNPGNVYHGEKKNASPRYTNKEDNRESNRETHAGLENPTSEGKISESKSETETTEEAVRGPVEIAAEKIWKSASKAARGRSSKTVLQRSIRTKAKQGHDIERIVAGWMAYLDTPDAKKNDGAFQPGPNVFINQDRFTSFTEEWGRSASPERSGERSGPFRVMRGVDDPKREREAQEFIVDRYQKHDVWNDDYGPRPGTPNCLFDPEVLKKFGYLQAPAAEDIPDDAAFD